LEKLFPFSDSEMQLCKEFQPKSEKKRHQQHSEPVFLQFV